MPKALMLYNIPRDANGKTWTPAALAPLIDRCIWTPELKREQYARDMQAVNREIEFHMYCLQHGAHLALPGLPNNNQCLTGKGEAEALLKQYPDIALHTPDGKVILKNQKQDYFVANTAHAEWRKRFVEHVIEVKTRAPFYSHLWLDDLGTESRFNYVGNRTVKEFPTRALYFNHTCDWLTYLQDAAETVGLGFGGNLQAPPDQFTDWQRAAGIMLTSGGNVLIEWGWFDHQGLYDKAHWLNVFQKADYVTRNGGQLNVIVQRDPRKLADKNSREYKEFMFALTSQMLISNGEDGMRVADQYDTFVDVPEIRGIDATLGKPLGSYRKVGDWYERDFEKHTIRVNPETFTYELIDPPIIIDPPPPPVKVKLSIALELEVAPDVAAAVQAAFSSGVDVSVTVGS